MRFWISPLFSYDCNDEPNLVALPTDFGDTQHMAYTFSVTFSVSADARHWPRHHSIIEK